MRAVRPDFQLIGCRRTERIARAQKHLFPAFAQKVCELSDRRRLAHAIHADDENDGRLCGKIERCRAHVHHALEHLAKSELCLLDGLDVPLAHDDSELLHGLLGRLHAEVGQNQALFQIVVKFVVQLGGRKDARNGARRLAQSLLQFFKKSHISILFSVH